MSNFWFWKALSCPRAWKYLRSLRWKNPNWPKPEIVSLTGRKQQMAGARGERNRFPPVKITALNSMQRQERKDLSWWELQRWPLFPGWALGAGPRAFQRTRGLEKKRLRGIQRLHPYLLGIPQMPVDRGVRPINHPLAWTSCLSGVQELDLVWVFKTKQHDLFLPSALYIFNVIQYVFIKKKHGRKYSRNTWWSTTS